MFLQCFGVDRERVSVMQKLTSVCEGRRQHASFPLCLPVPTRRQAGLRVYGFCLALRKINVFSTPWAVGVDAASGGTFFGSQVAKQTFLVDGENTKNIQQHSNVYKRGTWSLFRSCFLVVTWLERVDVWRGKDDP